MGLILAVGSLSPSGMQIYKDRFTAGSTLLDLGPIAYCRAASKMRGSDRELSNLS
jgi:hypothetical protein